MNLSELIPFLKSINASPKKSLSQNFLIDLNITKKIIRVADICPGDCVLEIGPGPGALTAALLEAGAIVYAIEKDTSFASSLTRLQTPDNRLKIFQADALTFPISEIPAKKVVANLPYHITTPLLTRFFSLEFCSLTLMVQKEFALRLLAKPHSKDFSSLTVFSQFYTSLNDSFPVSSHCFYPKPKVNSCVVRLDMRTPPISPSEPFFKLVRSAFQQRRKMISSSLQKIYPTQIIKEALTSLHLREDARPEMLSLEEWVLLFKQLHTTVE